MFRECCVVGYSNFFLFLLQLVLQEWVGLGCCCCCCCFSHFPSAPAQLASCVPLLTHTMKKQQLQTTLILKKKKKKKPITSRRHISFPPSTAYYIYYTVAVLLSRSEEKRETFLSVRDDRRVTVWLFSQSTVLVREGLGSILLLLLLRSYSRIELAFDTIFGWLPSNSESSRLFLFLLRYFFVI